ncbi:MAG: biosynthetic-type acetolactate synthase large subunit [Anaerolineae bacterium]|nr:biosynthetic-type acetolactate synthase large subunit [Caldilineales bacterium]MDW8270213.1 biosynthetic-type acetolactate synthase large subunit [Anaerolineae bacterium]
MKLKGAQIIWEALIREGVRVVFGYPGGAILPTYDALVQYPQIHHVLVRHEQGAAHMAEGYARASGQVGVCMATSGPGATNLVTGLADAIMDSVPIVAITGQVPTNLLGNDAFQETDVTGITQPITKHNYLVTDVRELPRIMKEAFYIAREGRPGPVLIDICKDVQNASTEFVYEEIEIRLPGFNPYFGISEEAVRAAAALINQSKRPLIIAGHGVQMANATQELRHLAEKAEIPVTTTLLGLGDIPESHPLALGMCGMHGEAHTNLAIQACDLLIGIGMRFDDRVTGRLDAFAPNAKIIHLELDPAEVGKNVKPDVALVGDCKESLQALIPLVEPARHREWLAEIAAWRRDGEERDILNAEVDELIPPYVMRQLWHSTQGQCIVVTDVGQHQMWEAQYFLHERPHQLITSGGLGTMGFAVPAAIGAQIAKPEALVWAVVGDGGFQMTMQELAVIVQERLPVKIAIINNGFLGMVRQWQQLFYDKRYSHTPLLNPDFIKIAEAYDIPARRVTRREEVADAFAQANAHPGPFLIEFRVKEEVNVYPMVAPGAAVGDLIRRPKVVQGPSGVVPAW